MELYLPYMLFKMWSDPKLWATLMYNPWSL